MSRVMKHAWDDETVAWSEADLQMGVGYLLRQLQSHGRLLWAADMNAGKRSKTQGARLKNQGMMAGEPDIRVYLPGGVLAMFELKTRKGRRSQAQVERHEGLSLLGHNVYTIHATCPKDAAGQVGMILLKTFDVRVLDCRTYPADPA